MKITSDTTQYRITITDPVSETKRKLSFPLFGSIKEKRQQIKEIKSFINQKKIEVKKLEAAALITEAEIYRRAIHKNTLNMVLAVKSKRNQHDNPINNLVNRYKLTGNYTKLSGKSKYQYEIRANKFIEHLEKENIADVVQITKDHAISFMANLDCKASTFNKYLAVMSSLFKGLDIPNPFKDISRQNAELDATAKIPFTDSEVEKIFKSFSGDWKDICLIAAYTGMRFSDAIHLKKSNIAMDFNQQRHIIKLKPMKTQHTGRSLYIQLLPPLEFLLTKNTGKGDYFFPDKVEKYKAGTAHAGASLNHVIIKKFKAIGIMDKTFHCFRHYFVDKLRKAGFTNEQIGGVVGHSSTKQTRDYGDYHNPLELSKIM